jgi:hypothetical protein
MYVSEPETLLVTAPVDGRGRVRLDDAVRELGWLAGQHLTCVTSGGVATLRRDTGGAIVLGADRRATLAAAAWYAVGVRRGQRAAVVTDHDRDEVRVFSVVRLVEVVL